MKKLDLGHTFTLLANVGVIVGIVFLAIEISQNTETQRLSAAQQVLGLSYQTSMMMAADRSINESMAAARAGMDLELGQKEQIDSFLRGALRAMWQVYVQREYGFIDDDIFYSYQRGIPGFFEFPFAEEHWENGKQNYPENFRGWIDANR